MQRMNIFKHNNKKTIYNKRTHVINVREIASYYMCEQKKEKAVGPDGVAVEAFICNGIQLHMHLFLLFNCYVQAGH